MDRTFDSAYGNIDHPMTALEFWRLAAPVVAHIKDGHTYLWFPETVQTQLETTIPLFPGVQTIGNRTYFCDGGAAPDAPRQGCEIISINGIRAGALLDELRRTTIVDGNAAAKDSRIFYYGNFQNKLYGFGVESPFQVVYRDRKGKRQSATLAGVEMPKASAAWRARHPDRATAPNADLKFLDDSQIAVLTVRHWYDLGTNVTFLDFLKQSFTQIHERGTTNLIIDVRDDDGGNDIPVINLLGFLLDRPFRLYRDVTCVAPKFDFFKYDPEAKPVPAHWLERRADRKFHIVNVKFMELFQPSQPHYAGRVFALMNGRCFSSSTEFLSLLHSHKRATFIGQEPAGGYYGFTAGYYVHPILPHSKLQLGFGLWTYYQDVSGYKYSDRGVMPDYPISYSIDDLLADKDKEMELALSLARASEKPRARKDR
jgi:C-terminal processing protease CtpA/Prc